MHIQAAARSCKGELLRAKDGAWKLYNKNSNLISSFTNLALNTILLASCLIKRIPPIVPRVSFTLLSFTGMISINMQGRDWSKHMLDCRLALRFRTYPTLLLTAARVCVKGTNILLTCGLFAGAVIALAGYPQVSLTMFQVMRPIAMAALAGTISGEFIDYGSNKRLLGRLGAVHTQSDADAKIQAVAQNFIFMAYQPPYRKMDPRIRLEAGKQAEQMLALDAVRQMEEWALDSFKQGLAAQAIGRHSILTNAQSLHVYTGIEKALAQTQTMTKANIGLTTLGYISLGLCRLFPQTAIQYSLTLAMSLLYTGKMVYEKHLLNLLKKHLAAT